MTGFLNYEHVLSILSCCTVFSVAYKLLLTSDSMDEISKDIQMEYFQMILLQWCFGVKTWTHKRSKNTLKTEPTCIKGNKHCT